MRPSWPALVLAAGYGTRLRPLSDARAKAALPVAGRPLIVRVLEQLRSAGVTRIVVNLHHRAETITALLGDGGQLGLDIRYSWEPEPLGSAGGPARALPLLAADRFFVVNADTLADVDLPALASAHVRSGARATLAVAPADLVHYNALVADAELRLGGVVARGTPPSDVPTGQRPWHFVGIQVLDARALASVDPTRASDMIREVYPALLAGNPGAVRVFPTTGSFFDVGTPADYYETVQRIARREGRALDRGRDCVVAPTARIESSILWDRVSVGADACLTHCVVLDDVAIPPGVSYDRLVITPKGISAF